MELFKNKNVSNLLIALLVILVLFFATKTISEIKALRYVGAGIGPATTISFEGKGEIFASPDIANISFSVRESGKTQKEAQDKVSVKVNKVTKFVKENGVAEKDIKTENYSAYPQYDYGPQCIDYPCPPQKPPKIIGFEVNQNISVKVRNVDETGKILDLLASAAVTDINGPNFEIDEIEKVQAKARKLAIEDAKAKAEQLAKDLGIRLVRIVNFSEGGNYPIYGRAEFKALSADDAIPLPEIPVGENKIVSNVTITYEVR